MKSVRRLLLIVAVILGAFVLALVSLSTIASIRFYSGRDPTIAANPASTNSDTSPRPSVAERQAIAAEYPVYDSRGKEQTYLTLSEWYQVYSYNEFAQFLGHGGRQTDFPFIAGIRSFWSTYFLSLDKSRGQAFNWQYNFVSWLIGINLTIEYGIKSAYENTIGRVTQSIAGSDTEADRFIAASWNRYAATMYQTTWYHYPYFADLRGIWQETALFNRQFVRNAERKIALSVSYLLKGSYAQLWLLTAEEKENQTFSIVHAANRAMLNDEGIKIPRELSGDRFLIETERYAGFKNALEKLLSRNVTFVEIMGHDTIALAYLAKDSAPPFSSPTLAATIDTRELFYHPEGFKHRITLEARVEHLADTLRLITGSGGQFEMIYDF